MNAVRNSGKLIAILTFVLVICSFANAQTRTFVASTGSDSNPCSRALPCRTLQVGVNAVLANGEVIVLDTAGYGAVSINKGVTITSPFGIYAGVAVTSGTGISIAAGPADNVVLSGLQINGSNTATTGISFTSGKSLVVANCNITQFATGLNVINAKMDLIDSNLSGNTIAVSASGPGTEPNGSTTVSTTQVRISGGNIINNGTAFFEISPGTNTATTPPTPLANIFVHTLGRWDQAIPSVFDWTTNVTGNSTTVSGSGTGCPCSSIGTYSGGGGPK